jgi:hypothetical protein
MGAAGLGVASHPLWGGSAAPVFFFFNFFKGVGPATLVCIYIFLTKGGLATLDFFFFFLKMGCF